MAEIDPHVEMELLREAVKLQKEKKALSADHIKVLKEHNIYLEKASKHYEDQLKNIERYLDAAEKRKRGELELTEVIARQYEMQDAQIALQNAEIRQNREFLNDYEKRVEAQQQMIKAAREEEKQLKRLLKLQNKRVITEKELVEQQKLEDKFNTRNQEKLEELKKVATQRKEAAFETREALKDQKKEIETILPIQETNRDLTVENRDAVRGVDAGLQGMFKTFLGLSDQSNSFLGQLYKLTDGGKNWGAAMARVKKIWATLRTPVTGLVAIVGLLGIATMKWMMDFSKEASNFQKTTGIIESGFGSIQNRISEVQRANIKFGVSMEEAFASGAALATEMRGFNKLSAESSGQLIRITALMGEFGASAQTTGAIFNVFSKGLGYNSQQLENLGLKLTAISKSLGRPLQEVTEDFKAAMPELMKYGDGVTEVFAGLQEQSVATGIAMQELLGIAKQFDTFEDAGNAVGRLNAILGGPYLNAMQMVYATEEERIQLLRESVRATGRQFSDMQRHEKQAIASAAGINDMAQAEMLFGSTDAAYADRAMEMQEMADRAKAAQSVQDKLTQAMQTFAIALGPLVTMLSELMDTLLTILQPFDGLSERFPKMAGYLNNLTTVLGLAAIAWGVFKVNMLAALAPVAVFVFMYIAIKKVLDMLTEKLGPVGKMLVGFAAIVAAVGMAFAIAWAFPSVGSSMILWGAAIGAGLAGLATMMAGFSSLPKYAIGIDNAPGGPALVGEAGPEMITTGAGAYMAEGPTVVDLPAGANVLNNKNTEAATKRGARGAGSIPPELIASLKRLQGSIDVLNQNISVDRQKEPTAEQQVIIQMDGKKLADTVISRINKRSKLTISRAG